MSFDLGKGLRSIANMQAARVSAQVTEDAKLRRAASTAVDFSAEE